MEYLTVDYIDGVKERILPFVFFIAIPCLWWWYRFVIEVFKSILSLFFTIEYEDDGNKCCPHCHIHLPDPEPDSICAPKPNPSPDLSGGGMAVPPMQIPEREKEYIRRR